MAENVAAAGDYGGRNTILQTEPCSPVREMALSSAYWVGTEVIEPQMGVPRFLPFQGPEDPRGLRAMGHAMTRVCRKQGWQELGVNSLALRDTSPPPLRPHKSPLAPRTHSFPFLCP